MKVVFKLASRFWRKRDLARLWAIALFVALTCTSVSVSAQSDKPKSQSVVAPDDRSAVHVRYPLPEKLREFQTDRDYQYDHEAPPPENPVARFFNWLYRRFMDFLTSEAYQNIWQYILLAAIAGFVIYLLMKAEVLGFLFSKKAQSTGLDYENLAENIHEIDFNAAIEEAIGQRNFRLAVRLLYLQTLKHLTDSGLIAYKPDKTNRQYVYELANTQFQPDFDRLTQQFDFIWYGNFPIDASRFEEVRQQFQAFNQAVFQPNTVNRTGGPVETNFAKT
jgi:hypothetical protein